MDFKNGTEDILVKSSYSFKNYVSLYSFMVPQIVPGE